MSDAADGSASSGSAPSESRPRPPEGDWLGTPYLRFERRPPFAHLTVDRPEARNAPISLVMTPYCVAIPVCWDASRLLVLVIWFSQPTYWLLLALTLAQALLLESTPIRTLVMVQAAPGKAESRRQQAEMIVSFFTVF